MRSSRTPVLIPNALPMAASIGRLPVALPVSTSHKCLRVTCNRRANRPASRFSQPISRFPRTVLWRNLLGMSVIPPLCFAWSPLISSVS
jgi:hypothetical protein